MVGKCNYSCSVVMHIVKKGSAYWSERDFFCGLLGLESQEDREHSRLWCKVLLTLWDLDKGAGNIQKLSVFKKEKKVFKWSCWRPAEERKVATEVHVERLERVFNLVDKKMRRREERPVTKVAEVFKLDRYQSLELQQVLLNNTNLRNGFKSLTWRIGHQLSCCSGALDQITWLKRSGSKVILDFRGSCW